MSNCKSLLSKFFFNKEGSFTIEASLIFPIIFLIILCFIIVSIVSYQKASLYYISSLTAERAAYNWTNSYKDSVTGEFNIEKNDGLYWRLIDDNVIEILFGYTDICNAIEVEIGDDIYSANTLPRKKLLSIANTLPSGVEGKLIYQHNLQREIIVELESSIKAPNFVETLIGDKIRVSSKSIITDPVEYIRTVDFIRLYSDLLSKNKDSIKNILNKQKNKE